MHLAPLPSAQQATATSPTANNPVSSASKIRITPQDENQLKALLPNYVKGDNAAKEILLAIRAGNFPTEKRYILDGFDFTALDDCHYVELPENVVAMNCTANGIYLGHYCQDSEKIRPIGPYSAEISIETEVTTPKIGIVSRNWMATIRPVQQIQTMQHVQRFIHSA